MWRRELKIAEWTSNAQSKYRNDGAKYVSFRMDETVSVCVVEVIEVIDMTSFLSISFELRFALLVEKSKRGQEKRWRIYWKSEKLKTARWHDNGILTVIR